MGAWGHRVLCLRRTSEQAAVARMRLPWKSEETLDRFLEGVSTAKRPTVERKQAEAYLEMTLKDAETHAWTESGSASPTGRDRRPSSQIALRPGSRCRDGAGPKVGRSKRRGAAASSGWAVRRARADDGPLPFSRVGVSCTLFIRLKARRG